jgi:hypothetical protein
VRPDADLLAFSDGRSRLRFLHYVRHGDSFALAGPIADLADPLLGVSEVQVAASGSRGWRSATAPEAGGGSSS